MCYRYAVFRLSTPPHPRTMASQLAKQYFFFLGALFFAMARLDTALALSPASNSHNILVLSSLFKGQLLFITRFKKRDDYVYQYPLSSLDVSGHRLNTAGASSPVSLRTKWSVLGTAAHDAIVTSAIVANAPKHEVAFLVTRNWRGDTATSFFDFSKADHFDLTALSWDGTVWLSSGSFDKTYYSLKTNGSLALGKYQLGYDGNEPTSDLVDSNMANLKVPYLAVCLKGKDTVLLSKGSCSKVAQWKVTAGMVVMDRFYLFSQEAVYAFDVKAFDTPETEVKLDHCSRNVFFGEPDNLTYKSSGALSKCSILLLILLISIIIFYANPD